MTVIGMNVFSTLDDGQTNQHAFGPVILTNKEDYYATGGHKVRTVILLKDLL